MPRVERSKVGTKRERRPGVWEVRVSSGYRRDGEPRRVTRTIHGSERDADVAIARLSAEMGRAPAVGEEGISFRDYWDLYYHPSLLARHLARATVALYESTWAAHLEPAWGGRDILSVPRSEVKRWLYSIEAPGARNNAMKLMRQMLNATIDDELQDTHAMMRPIAMPRPTAAQRAALRSRRPAWGPSELMVALDYVEGHVPAILPVCVAMAGAGLRREEAVALSREKLSFVYGDDGCLCYALVDDAYTPRDKFRSATKTGQDRVVVLADPFATRLDLCAPEWGPLCPHSRWGVRECAVMDPGRVSTLWHDMFSCHGGGLSLPYITLNQLRHTHESLMQSAGVLDTVNSRFHGHSRLETDYAHYLVPGLPEMEDAARMVSELLQASTR